MMVCAATVQTHFLSKPSEVIWQQLSPAGKPPFVPNFQILQTKCNEDKPWTNHTMFIMAG